MNGIYIRCLPTATVYTFVDGRLQDVTYFISNRLLISEVWRTSGRKRFQRRYEAT